MKKRKGGGGASWMDTYGDMVTLLLCFFVLLYSMSTIDEQKWVQLIQSFNPDAVHEITDNQGNNGQVADPATPVDGDMTQDQIATTINQLYLDLKEYVARQGAGENISVTKGDGYVFISFNDTIFFSGDSYELQPAGEGVLDDVAAILTRAAPAIDELRILGHTAQGSPTRPNNVKVDRFLASNRATNVLVYLQEKGFLDPARMVSLGYGQWRPVAGNDTGDDRAKNRRVEMIVTGKDLLNAMGDSIEQYYTQKEIEPPVTARPGADGGAAADIATANTMD